MPDSHLASPKKTRVPDESFSGPLSSRLAIALRDGRTPYARFVSKSRSSGWSVVTFDVDVELPQDRKHDVRPTERISARFADNECLAPVVLAMRPDFPLVPHSMIYGKKLTKRLCLTEIPWCDERLTWTPIRFVKQIRRWLSLTAVNALHAKDQPLEPIILGSGTLILPVGIKPINTGLPLDLAVITTIETQLIMAAFASNQQVPFPIHPELRSVAIFLTGKPQTHGIIKPNPKTLSDLDELLRESGIDLFNQIRTHLVQLRVNQTHRERKLVIIVCLPTKRFDDRPTERLAAYAFLAMKSIRDLYESLDAIPFPFSATGLSSDKTTLRIGKVGVLSLNVMLQFSRTLAAHMSGRRVVSRKCLAIGQGAVGSLVVNNLIRSGFGDWMLVDKDILLPHNLARHVLDGSHVCLPKASAMQAYFKSMMIDTSVSVIDCDLIRPNSKNAQLVRAFNEADLILDFSASIGVERYIATDIDSAARRISIFLSPDGCCLVMLAEDPARTLKLHDLEAQFHRLILKRRQLRDFYRGATQTLHYGRSCGDVSAQIPQERIAIHAGLATAAIHKLGDRPAVFVWCLSTNLSVERYQIAPSPCKSWLGCGWSVVSDVENLDSLRAIRASMLPAETGGVLVGTLDMQRQEIRVVDVLSLPCDTIEERNGLDRGVDCLKQDLARISKRSGYHLRYVGMWHSHSKDMPLAISPEDRKYLRDLTHGLELDGVPEVIVTVSHNGVQCHIEGRHHKFPPRSSPRHSPKYSFERRN